MTPRSQVEDPAKDMAGLVAQALEGLSAYPSRDVVVARLQLLAEVASGQPHLICVGLRHEVAEQLCRIGFGSDEAAEMADGAFPDPKIIALPQRPSIEARTVGFSSPGQLRAPRPSGRVLEPNLDLEVVARDGIPPIGWVAEGWFVPGDATILVGDSGEGKSTTAAQISIAAVNGTTAFDTISFRRPMRVLYFDSETGDQLLARLLLRLNGGKPIPRDRLSIFSMLDIVLPEDNFADLAATIADAGEPCFVVVDSVTALFGLKDENSASEVGPVLQCLRQLAERTGSVILALHHATKPPSDARFKRARKDRARGSSAFRGQSTAMMFQERTGTSTAILEQTKRRGAGLTSVRITLSEPDGPDGAIELHGEPVELSETKAEQLEDLLLEALEALAPGEDATTGSLQDIAKAAGHRPKSVSRTLNRLAKPAHGPARVLKPKKGHWMLVGKASAPAADRTMFDQPEKGEP